VGLKNSVEFDFAPTNQSTHMVRSFFFGSPAEAPGASFTVGFFGCGKFTVTEDEAGAGPTMTVKVPLKVSPATGTTATRFLLTLGKLALPPGAGFTIQDRYPGSDGWTVVTKFHGGSQFGFFPGHGPGTYDLRAFSREIGVKDHADWSKPVSIQVMP
jgi:hypothetical protein